MSAPVTELVDFTIPSSLLDPPSTTSTTSTSTTALSLLAQARTTLLAQPGCLRARFSLHHEKKKGASAAATLFIDWDALSSHRAFTADEPVFGPMKASLAPLAPRRPYHAALDPTPPAVLDAAPVVEVLHLYFPAVVVAGGSPALERDQTVLATLREFAALTEREAGSGGGGGDGGMVGTPTLGWVVEELEWKKEEVEEEGAGGGEGQKARVAVLMLGWRSVEAHMAYRETEAFKGSVGMVRELEGLLGMKMYHVSCAEV